MTAQPVLVLILTAVLLLCTGPAVLMATEVFAQQEEIECNACHADAEQDASLLTDQGLYYQYMKTLEGYDQVIEKFEGCTYCRVEQAGAKTLTGEGYRFRWMMQDMAGLRAWLDENHPKPDKETDTSDDPD